VESSNLESLSGTKSNVEGIVSASDSLGSLRQEAQELFDAGKLQEAGRVCEAILSRYPQDGVAVSLKDTIRATLAEPKIPAEEAVPSERTTQLHQPSGGESPGTQAPNVQDRKQLLPPDASPQPALSNDRAALNVRPVDATTQKPSERRPAGQQLAAAKQALPAPTASQVSTVPQIRPDQLRELDSRIQAKDFVQARVLFEQLKSAFPTNRELTTLGERLRLEAGKQQSLALSWIEKAEVAWIAGRYVTPADDNAVAYCNLALKADPKNQRATNLRREIVHRAVAQAKDWIQRGKFEEARRSYAAMDDLAGGDDAFPYPKLDLKRELEKVTFSQYTVVHDHKLSSCSGILKFNDYAVSYVPSKNSDDGFAGGLNTIVINADGERLKIRSQDRTFRFRSENETTVKEIYQQLTARMSDRKSTLATRNEDVR
jgi:hypothetical protein